MNGGLTLLYFSGQVTILPLGYNDAFVSAFEADGAARWTHVFGSPFNETDVRVAVGRDGSVTVAGTTTGEVVAGSGETNDAFVRRLDADGAVLWTRQAGTGDYDEFFGLAVARDGGVLVVGSTYGALDGFTNAGALDAIVIRLVP